MAPPPEPALSINSRQFAFQRRSGARTPLPLFSRRLSLQTGYQDSVRRLSRIQQFVQVHQHHAKHGRSRFRQGKSSDACTASTAGV